MHPIHLLKVRSHQTRMKHYVRIIYMLCQCKDRHAIDNPAALFVNSASWKIWTLADIRTALTNQELDLAVTSLRAEAETMEDKVIVVVCGYPELYIHLSTFTKTGIHFATRLELPGRSPSHDTYSRLLCSEFHTQMVRISHANAVNFTREWSE